LAETDQISGVEATWLDHLTRFIILTPAAPDEHTYAAWSALYPQTAHPWEMKTTQEAIEAIIAEWITTTYR